MSRDAKTMSFGIASDPVGTGTDSTESSPWVSEGDGNAQSDNLNVTLFDPCPEPERFQVRSYAKRLETFTTMKWKASLCKSKTCNPEKMAEIGWFCTGTDSAKCYACFKDLEGWVAKDNPKKEHEDHCPNCPLVVLGIDPRAELTIRQQLQLNTKIEFYRLRLIRTREWEKVQEKEEAQKKVLVEMQNKLKKELEYEYGPDL
ncbi:hypothetical protein RvY_07605 [Ramazzottius varieornatus]|uniref:Uncharacterized protein n=1 Tax=Ramazzottius varieornatus TaxID=947166 RepID=A0A1D1V2S4_RAMVA|nr:hypothetical protein RvY_07605 [Ramazzottius varieornatus]